jgi:NADH-quinone oxidoreductase subunit N
VSPDIVNAILHAFPLLVPEMVLGLGACVLFLGATFLADRHLWGTVALVALAGAGLALWLMPYPAMTGDLDRAVYASPLWLDGLALWTKVVALVGGLVLVCCSWNDVPDSQAAEYHACLLLMVAGLSLTGSANELITLFLALELISIPTYILLYLPRLNPASQESAMKYFLLSIFSSALLLFGFSYLYGLTGTTNLPALTEALTQGGAEGLPAVSMIALVMVVAGLGFKITAVPFHFYAPDVYQGTTTSAAAILAFVPKVAGFVALIRILGFVPYGLADDVQRLGSALGPQVPILLWILAAVTMTLGNILALLQDNLKRLLAYSSVAHAGYMLIGLAVAPSLHTGLVAGLGGGVEAVLFYLVAYGAMTIGAFAVMGYLSTMDRPVEKMDDLAGLNGRHPGLALVMTVFLFSLIGMPLTAGFVGKLVLFLGALAVPGNALNAASLTQVRLFRILALIGAINAAIGAVYYLRIIALMYLRSALRPLEPRRAVPGLAALVICVVVTLVAGIYPQALWLPVQGVMPRPVSQVLRPV